MSHKRNELTPSKPGPAREVAADGFARRSQMNKRVTRPLESGRKPACSSRGVAANKTSQPRTSVRSGVLGIRASFSGGIEPQVLTQANNVLTKSKTP
jgi:hypothetical protein